MQCQGQFQQKISQNLIPLILKLLMEMIEEDEDDNNDSDSSTPHLSLLNPFLYIKDKQKVGCLSWKKKGCKQLGPYICTLFKSSSIPLCPAFLCSIPRLLILTESDH